MEETKNNTVDFLDRMYKNVKMGVCSQNGAGIIKRSLEHHGVLKYFGAVIGVDDVLFEEQKVFPY